MLQYLMLQMVNHIHLNKSGNLEETVKLSNIWSYWDKDGNKIYSQTEKAVIGSPEALPIAIRAMHKEMGNMAVRSIDRYNASERYFTGMTIGVNEETYSRIIDEINICAKKIAAIANESDNLNQVYGLNLQLFPFTNKIEGESHA